MADYSSSRFRAVVDWIELEIQTTRPTNFMAIQKELRRLLCLPDDVNPYVKAQDEGYSRAATIFRIRLQDPERHYELENVIHGLSVAFGCRASPRITAIEIAFDAYGAGAEQAARFYKFLTNLVSDNRRMYRSGRRESDFTQSVPNNFDSMVKHLHAGWQVGIGDKSDDSYQHAYFKTTDNSGAPIPQSDHRARIEVTLRGEALPFRTLEELHRFKFGSLSEFFRFRKLKPDLSPLDQTNADASAQIGQRRARNRRGGGTRLHSRLTQADADLNARARDALKELSRRWRTMPKRAKRSPTAAIVNECACGNTGETKPANPHECEESGGGSNNYIRSSNNDSQPEEQFVQSSSFGIEQERIIRQMMIEDS